CQQYNTLPYIF
nr:immunoglobulin light chain junction region [Macaca mulatta]MOX99548.1 immunoglobulin light chain junction region [Macaca mulatta]